MRKSGRLRLGPASAYSRRSTAAARKPLMDDSAQKPFMPADAFGRSLSGFGVNILVSDVAATLAFLQEVLTVAVVHADAGFAVCRYGDHLWMLHGDATSSEEHTSAPQSQMRNTYAVLCLKKKNTTHN